MRRLSGLLVGFMMLSPAVAQAPLNGDAIRAKIAGNIITIVTKNLQLATGFIESDGKIRGHIGGESFEGTWSIEQGDELCFDLPDQTFDLCRRVVEAGKNLDFFTTTGEPGGRAEILKGNPYDL